LPVIINIIYLQPLFEGNKTYLFVREKSFKINC